MKKITYLSFLAPLALAACTTNVDLRPSAMPAGDVMANRIVQTPTSYSFSSDFRDKGHIFECGAYSYKSNFGQPIADTIKKTINVGFAHANEEASDINSAYKMRIDMEDVDAQVSVMPGFWSVTYTVHVDLSGKVDVTDSTGTSIVKAEITGSGSASATGNCTMLTKAVQTASEKAIKKMGSDFAFKVIDTNVLK
jgi:hypothetical protein